MPWRDLYPFDSHYLSLPGGRLHYLDEGAGQPLLFVHGNPTWSFYWRNRILGLRDRYRCVAVDHIGCGLSDKPQDYNYTLKQRIDDLVQLVERQELTGVTLLAHDWGGAIGLGAADLMNGRDLPGLGDNVQTAISWSAVGMAFAVATATGLFFGIYPASRASKLRPIDALHYE